MSKWRQTSLLIKVIKWRWSLDLNIGRIITEPMLLYHHAWSYESQDGFYTWKCFWGCIHYWLIFENNSHNIKLSIAVSCCKSFCEYALVDNCSSMYLFVYKSSWFPGTLFLLILERNIKRKRKKNKKLGSSDLSLVNLLVWDFGQVI